MNIDDEMVSMSEDARHDVEQKEDDFVAQTEEAVGVMKNVRSVYSRQFWSLHLVDSLRY